MSNAIKPNRKEFRKVFSYKQNAALLATRDSARPLTVPTLPRGVIRTTYSSYNLPPVIADPFAAFDALRPVVCSAAPG